MARHAVAACIAALVLALPTALAALVLYAPELQLIGETRVESDAAALFLVSEQDAFSWEASADSATLVREFAAFVAADTPLDDDYQFFKADDWQTETIELGHLTLASQGTLPEGALLVGSDGATLRASTDAMVQIGSVVDPMLSQGPPPDADAGGADGGEIVQVLEGEFLQMAFNEGTFTLVGDLTLRMYGPAYVATSDGAATEWRTGEFETARTLVYAEGRQERHTITLRNAVLQVRADEPLTLLARFTTLELDGTVKAPRAEGALDVGTGMIAPPADGAPLHYTGAARLALAPSGGQIAATSPGAGIATAGAIAPQAPPVLALSAAALLVLALAGAGVAVWARRARRDDMALALLAMEERRWEDALPHLDRLARRDPSNAAVLVDRALCLEQVGRFEQAARAFEGALRAAPRHAEAHFYYARTLAKMREREAARAHLEEALERDPRLAEMARAEAVLRGL